MQILHLVIVFFNIPTSPSPISSHSVIIKVSSPLTQLTLHPSPQHPASVSPLSQPVSKVKVELQSSCSLSRLSSASCQPPESQSGGAVDALDKDQMLQEKDKQIEELTRMLRQKQRLVETLRSQLEQGKVAGGAVSEKDGSEKSRTSPEGKPQTHLIKASVIQPPTLPGGVVVQVKKEEEPEEGMEGVTEEAQAKKPMQCSQETLLRLQQIHRLQVQQAEQQKQMLQQSQVQSQKVAEAKQSPQKLQQQQKKEAQILLQQQQLQQLIIQQTQQKQLQAQQRLAQQKLVQQKLSQVKPTPGQVPQNQQKNPSPVPVQKPAVSQIQQRRQLKAQQRRQQRAAVTTQQVVCSTTDVEVRL